MELEQMKSLWGDMSQQIEKQNHLTDKRIFNMTQEKFNHKLKKASTPELVGGIVCMFMTLLILVNLGKLDTWYLLTSSLLSIVVFLIIGVLSFYSIKKMTQINVSKSDYKETLKQYYQGKKLFLFNQKLSYHIAFPLLFTLIPVVTKIMTGFDLFAETEMWKWFAPLGAILFFISGTWILKVYKALRTEAQSFFSELENEQ